MTITEEEFEEKYKPLKNPHNPDAPWDGCMWETYGVEHNFVRNQSQRMVWTVLDGGTIVSGYRTVDRMGYIVTLNPWTEDVEVVP